MKLKETLGERIMIPDFCSRLFTNDKIYFGGYPSAQNLLKLKDIGVKYIIDCTTPKEKEKLKVYNAKEYDMTYLHYPIPDNYIPTDIHSFQQFIAGISSIITNLKRGESVYIHCRGGHGRSGMVSACILCHLYRLKPCESIRELTKSHIDRKLLSPRWKTRLCPPHEIQRMFIYRMFRPAFTRDFYRIIPPTRIRFLTKK